MGISSVTLKIILCFAFPVMLCGSGLRWMLALRLKSPSVSFSHILEASKRLSGQEVQGLGELRAEVLSGGGTPDRRIVSVQGTPADFSQIGSSDLYSRLCDLEALSQEISHWKWAVFQELLERDHFCLIGEASDSEASQ